MNRPKTSTKVENHSAGGIHYQSTSSTTPSTILHAGVVNRSSNGTPGAQ